jgi:hypothetical protein
MSAICLFWAGVLPTSSIPTVARRPRPRFVFVPVKCHDIRSNFVPTHNTGCCSWQEQPFSESRTPPRRKNQLFGVTGMNESGPMRAQVHSTDDASAVQPIEIEMGSATPLSSPFRGSASGYTPPQCHAPVSADNTPSRVVPHSPVPHSPSSVGFAHLCGTALGTAFGAVDHPEWSGPDGEPLPRKCCLCRLSMLPAREAPTTETIANLPLSIPCIHSGPVDNHAWNQRLDEMSCRNVGADDYEVTRGGQWVWLSDTWLPNVSVRSASSDSSAAGSATRQPGPADERKELHQDSTTVLPLTEHCH